MEKHKVLTFPQQTHQHKKEPEPTFLEKAKVKIDPKDFPGEPGDDARERYERGRRTVRESNRKLWRDRAGINEAVAQLMDGPLIDNEAMIAVRAWDAAGKPPVLVLSGQPQTGKTVAAVWWLWKARLAWEERQETEGYVPGAHLGALLGCYWYSQERPDRRRDDPRRDQSLLVLDDLGREPRQAREAVEELLYHRLETEGHTVVTTNLSDQDLRDTYDGRLVERLALKAKIVTVAS